jgi:DNA-directed RNA polymerase specialized sigma24 family protein
LNHLLKEYLAINLCVRRRTPVRPQRDHRLERRLGLDAMGQLAAEYAAGGSVLTLARRYSVSKTAVLELVAEAEVIRHRNVMTDEIITAARRLRKQGLPYREIGERLGVHKDTVRRALVPLAGHSEGVFGKVDE